MRRAGTWAGRLATAAAVVASFLIVALVGILALLHFKADAVGDMVARRLSAMTGREVRITGDFGVTPSLVPTVSASGLSIANAQWGSSPTMLSAEQVEVELALVPLLTDGQVRIDRIGIVGALVVVESGPDGNLNWQLRQAASEEETESEQPGSAIEIEEAELLDSRVEWRRGEDSAQVASISRLAWQTDRAGGGMTFVAHGRYAGGALIPDRGEADGWPTTWRVDAAVVDGEGDIRIVDVDARIEDELGIVLEVENGIVERPLAGEGLTLPVIGEAVSLAAIGEFFDADLPTVGPIQISGVLTGTTSQLKLADASGRIGDAESPLLRLTDGTIENLLDGSELEARLEAKGASLAEAGERLGLDLPALGSYEATAVVAGDLSAPRLEDLDAVVRQADRMEIRITDASIEEMIRGAGLRIPFELEGTDLSALSSIAGWSGDLAALTSASARGTVTGTIQSPGVQDLDATLRRAESSLKVTGSVADVRSLRGLDADVAVDGPDLAQLSAPLGRDLPTTPPFQLTFAVTSAEDAIAVENIVAMLGNTEAEGQLRVLVEGRPRPRIEGRITARRVDVDQLGSISSGDDGGDQPATLDAPWLDAVDAELAVRAEEIVTEDRVFREAAATVRLSEGLLSIEDLTAQVAGGTMTGDAQLDSRGAAAAEVAVRLNVRDVKLADLIAGQQPGDLVGSLDLDLNVDATGRTIDGLLSELDGQVAVFAGDGRLENVPLNRMIPDLDIARILPFVGGGRSTIRVNCLVGEFDIVDGVARTDAMLDTERMTLLGEGTIDLDQQTLDLALQPMAKSRKLSTAEVPVDITGSLSDPKISPRKGAVVGGLVRGVLGGLLLPLNQLTALFGPEATDACGQALRQARERAEGTQGQK